MIHPTPLGVLGLVLDLFTLTVLLGILVGCVVTLRLAAEKGISRTMAMDLLASAVLGGLAGARTAHVAVNWAFYAPDPLSVFNLAGGGFSGQGALLGGIAAVVLFSIRASKSPQCLLDAAAPGAALGFAVAQMGCDVYGTPTTLPWAVILEGVSRHPAQLYLALLYYVVFIFLYETRGRFKRKGQSFLYFVFLSSLGRLPLEELRGGNPAWGGLTYNQLISLLLVLVSLALLAAPSLLGASRNRATVGSG